MASLTTMIAAFPKPTSMVFSYPKEWGVESTHLWGPATNGEIMAAIGQAAVKMGKGAADIATDGLYASLSAKTKLAYNQRNKVIFQDLPFREISLQWELMPRSKAQAGLFIGFINAIKIMSAPAYASGDILWDTSDLSWTLKMESHGASGVTLFESQEMVIKNITVDFTPNGHWSQHADGFPTKIGLTIELQETHLLDRASFAQGYT